MADRRWLGTAPAIAQVTKWTFGGTWLSAETITATIGTKSYTTTAGSTTLATVVQNVVDALNALDQGQYKEHGEQTYSKSSNDVVATANTPGVPFTISFSTNSASGTIAAASTTTANSGPNCWDTAANWSGGAVPVGADNVYIDEGNVDILYGLDASAVTLTLLKTSLRYRGNVGLPSQNPKGYAEYRDQELKVSATTLTLGDGSGLGARRFRINLGSVQTTATVHGSGQSGDAGTPAVQIRGTHASNVLNVIGGDVGTAVIATHTATWATIRQTGGQLRCGTGCTLTTINKSGGALETDSAAATVTNDSGLFLAKSGAHTTVTMNGGILDYRSTGTITTLTLNNGAVLDLSRSNQARTVTTLNQNPPSTIVDPNDTLTIGTHNWKGRIVVTAA